MPQKRGTVLERGSQREVRERPPADTDYSATPLANIAPLQDSASHATYKIKTSTPFRADQAAAAIPTPPSQPKSPRSKKRPRKTKNGRFKKEANYPHCPSFRSPHSGLVISVLHIACPVHSYHCAIRLKLSICHVLP